MYGKDLERSGKCFHATNAKEGVISIEKGGQNPHRKKTRYGGAENVANAGGLTAMAGTPGRQRANYLSKHECRHFGAACGDNRSPNTTNRSPKNE